MVSVGVPKLCRTGLIIVQPEVKINGAYYRDVLLKQQLLPVIRGISGDFFAFQQDRALSHRARQTVSLLQQDRPAFNPPELWPPNSLDLNPVDYEAWGEMPNQTKVRSIGELVTVWNELGQSVIDDVAD